MGGNQAKGLRRAHMLMSMRRQVEPFKIERTVELVQASLAAGHQRDPRKAARNAEKHRVTFDEASTSFGDPRSLLMTDSAATDRDTLRPEYDFSRAVRGMTAARYAEERTSC